MKKPLHPLEHALQSRVQLLATTLRPSTIKMYRHTVRLFLQYLGQNFPEVQRPAQLRRDPHLLGWFEFLWTRRVNHTGKAWRTATRAEHLVRLRKLLELLCDSPSPPRPGLLRSEDIPRRDDVLPRPLTVDDDARLRTELRQRGDDWLANVLLLARLTGMRIGEAADLSVDCLRHLGGDQWTLHVPLGKMHNDRLVPVDEEVRTLIARLQFLRTLPPAAPPEFLLPRPSGRAVLVTQIREALHKIAAQAGITAQVVPHQLRHTFATSMLRAGVSLPALMKLLGHRNANMTLRYVEVTQQDLQREFHLARLQPRHAIPLPSSQIPSQPDVIDGPAIQERLSAVIRLMDLFRQQNLTDTAKPLQLLLRRLVRIRSCFEKLARTTKTEK
jgi:site-specific recombinase XerD